MLFWKLWKHEVQQHNRKLVCQGWLLLQLLKGLILPTFRPRLLEN